jgi:hypothetical protein
MTENEISKIVLDGALKNDVHLAQILTYLKLSNCKLGMLINFNVSLIKNGIKRVINEKLWPYWKNLNTRTPRIHEA